MQVKNFTLKRLVTRARIARTELNASDAILTHHAAPKGVVTIQDQAFVAFATQCTKILAIFSTAWDQHMPPEGRTADLPVALIYPVHTAKPRQQAHIIHQVNIPPLALAMQEFLIQCQNTMRLALFRLRIQDSLRWRKRKGEIIAQDRHIGVAS